MQSSNELFLERALLTHRQSLGELHKEGTARALPLVINFTTRPVCSRRHCRSRDAAGDGAGAAAARAASVRSARPVSHNGVDQRNRLTAQTGRTGVLDVWKSMRKTYLNVTAWVDWITSWMPKFPLLGAEEELEETHGEIMALEILMRSNEHGYFGASDVPRSPRPEYVLHRVGEVVIDIQNHMVGVIVGWDEGLRAPPEWLKRKKYTDSEVKKLENTPHYKILFSGPDPSSLMIGYLPQNVLQLFEGYRLEIPTLDQYFSYFNGKKFVMLDWLKAIYPDD